MRKELEIAPSSWNVYLTNRLTLIFPFPFQKIHILNVFFLSM